MNSKSSGEKKRVAHIGNLSNTCLQGESKLPPDDYVFSILESMNTTLNNSEKKVVTYQQLQEFRSSKTQALLDIDSGLGNPSSSINSQNDSSYSMKQRKRILPPKTYPLMAKCQKNLKYLKHNRCVPKPRAHLGFPQPHKKKVLKNPESPFKNEILNNISNKVKKMVKSTKLKSNMSKISNERSLDFNNSSSANKDFEKNPSKEESDMELEDEFENETLDSISDKVEKKTVKSSKLKLNKRKITKERSPEFGNNSTNKDLEKNSPSEKEFDLESEDEFENFIRKHHPPKRKKQILNFLSDSSDTSKSLKKNKVKTLKKKRSSRKQDKEVTISRKGNLGSLESNDSSKSATKAVNKNKTKNSVHSVLSERSRKCPVRLQKDVNYSSDEDTTTNSMNDFDAFCHDSSDSFDVNVRDDSDILNVKTVPAFASVNNFSQLFDNIIEKEAILPCTNSVPPLETSLAMNSNNSVSQNIENQKLMQINVVPCSVLLKRYSALDTNSRNSIGKSCVNGDSYSKKSSTLGENSVLDTPNTSHTESSVICNTDSNSDFSCYFKNAANTNINVLNSHSEYRISFKTTDFPVELDRAKDTILSENLMQSNNKLQKSANDSEQNLSLEVKSHALNKTLTSENSPNKITEHDLDLKSGVIKHSPMQTESKNKSNERFESDSDDCVILDDIPKENSGDKNECLQKPESMQKSLLEQTELRNNDSKESNNLDILKESNTDICIQNSNIGLEFNVKIISVHSLGESNSKSIINSLDKNIKEQFNSEISEAAIKLEDSDIEIIDLEISPIKDETKLLVRSEETLLLSDQLTETFKSGVSIMKKEMPLPQNIHASTIESNNTSCVHNNNRDSVTSVNKLQRKNEQSNAQILNECTDNSNKNPKLTALSVTEKNKTDNVSKDPSLMSDCIIIDNEFPSPVSLIGDNSAKSSKVNFVCILDKSVNKELEPLKNVSQDEMNDSSLSKNMSMIPDDCIVIDYDESAPTVTAKQDSDISTKGNYAGSSNKNLSEELKPLKNLNKPDEMNDSSLRKNTTLMIPDDCIVIDDDESPPTVIAKQDDISTRGNYAGSSNKNLSEELKLLKNLSKPSDMIDNTLYKNTSLIISEDCIIIDDESLSLTFCSKRDNSKSDSTSQAKKKEIPMCTNDEGNRSAINPKNSIQNDDSSTEKPLLTLRNCNDSSRFKPDCTPNEQVLGLLKVIDFEGIKNILKEMNETNSIDCDENPVSSDVNINSKLLCQVKENLKDDNIEKSTYISETKCHENSLLSENIQVHFPSVKDTGLFNISSPNSSSGPGDSPEIIHQDENKSNLEVNYNFNWKSSSANNCVKIENNCSYVRAGDISSNVKGNEGGLKRKSSELLSVEKLEFRNALPLKSDDIPLIPDTLKGTSVYKKQKFDLLKSTDIHHDLQKALNCKPSVQETVKQEVTFENTSDELDAIASSSIETLNDLKQTSVIRLIELYKEECKKYQEIKCTGRNLSAGLNLLHDKQVEKLKHIQSSIKNILKYDPCFHKIVKDVEQKCLKKSEPSLKKDGFQGPGQPAYSNTKTEPHVHAVVKTTCTQDYQIFNPSIFESAQKAIMSHSTVSALRDKEVYEHLINSRCACCGKPATAACQGCFKVYYCSTECGIISWDRGHNATCGT